jgi:hypothetical protein
MSEANAAYDARRFQDAARSYATLAQVFEDWPEKREEGLPVILSFLADSQWKAGDPRRASRTYARLGEIHDAAGEGQEAEFNWEAAARSSSEANQVGGDAEHYARKAVNAGRGVGDSLMIGRAMSVLAQALWRNKKTPEAVDVLQDALELVPSGGEDANWTRYACFELLARISLSAEDWPTALHWSQELTATMEGLPDPDGRWRGRVDDLMTVIHERMPR